MTNPNIHHEMARCRMRHQNAQADLKVAKAKAEMDVISQLNGSYGKNAEERERQLIIGLAEHRAYQSALVMARQLEAQYEMSVADYETYRDARRVEEWSIRAQLADAISQRTPSADAASTDAGIDDVVDAELTEAAESFAHDGYQQYQQRRTAHAATIDRNRAYADVNELF
jgi:hypothetical protein